MHNPVSRKKGTIALIVSSYASLVLVMIKGIVLVPLYLYYIDNRLYGAWLATGSIIAYFGMFDFGLNSVLLQRIGSNYGKGDVERLGSVLGTGLVIGLVLCFLPILLGLLISPGIPTIVKITGVQTSQLRQAFILAAAGTSLMLAMYCMGGVLVAFQRQIIHGLALVVGDILGVSVTLILLTAGYGLLAIPAGTIVWAVITALGDGFYLWWFIKKKLPQMRVRIKKEHFKDLSRQSVWQFGARSTSTLARHSDNLIVAAFIDPSLCTVLTLTKKASEMLILLVSHFAGAFLPSLSHLHGENDKEKFKKITLLLFKVTSFAGICFMGGYLFFNRYFMDLWVGSKFYGGTMLTTLFCMYGVFYVLATTFYNVIFAKGEMITVAKANITEALLRIPVCIILVALWGIEGAAMAALLAIIPSSFWMQAKSFIKVLNLSGNDVLIAARTMGLQISVVLGVGIMFNGSEPEGIVKFIFSGGLYMVVVLSICVLLDKDLRSNCLNVQRRFLNKYLVKA